VKEISISVILDEELSIRHKTITHNKFSINNGEFFGIIHKGLSGLIKKDENYRFWYDIKDAIEILGLDTL
jgi:hypothetical protein